MVLGVVVDNPFACWWVVDVEGRVDGLCDVIVVEDVLTARRFDGRVVVEGESRARDAEYAR